MLSAAHILYFLWEVGNSFYKVESKDISFYGQSFTVQIKKKPNENCKRFGWHRPWNLDQREDNNCVTKKSVRTTSSLSSMLTETIRFKSRVISSKKLSTKSVSIEENKK